MIKAKNNHRLIAATLNKCVQVIYDNVSLIQ